MCQRQQDRMEFFVFSKTGKIVKKSFMDTNILSEEFEKTMMNINTLPLQKWPFSWAR